MLKLRRQLLSFGLAVIAVGFALLARWLVDPIVGDRIPFVTVLAAVAVAVGYGGLYPALLATALGYVGCSLLFGTPRGVLWPTTPGEWITVAGYLLACTIVTAFGLLMRRAQEKHRQAALELAALNQHKDELMATVAHELRNPLTPIRHAVEVLRTVDATQPELGPARDMIDRQVQHLTRLIDDLVAMDRIERRQLDLRTQRLDLAEVVRSAVEASRSLLHRGRQVQVTEPGRPLIVEGDRDRLEQIVANLITNAVKFTPAPGHIQIALTREDGHAVLRVEDEGVGIASDALPRLFEMFYQADPKQRGLGIGLALVRHLTSLHGGTITADSAGKGKGSTFVVRLPLASDPIGTAEPERQGALTTGFEESVGAP